MWDRCLSKRYGVYSKLRFWLRARWWWRGEFRATVYLWFRWWRIEFESSSAGLSHHLQPGRAAKIPHTTLLREGCSLLVLRNARHCPVLELQQRKTPTHLPSLPTYQPFDLSTHPPTYLPSSSISHPVTYLPTFHPLCTSCHVRRLRYGEVFYVISVLFEFLHSLQFTFFYTVHDYWHYQNEWEPGSESISQRHLGSFRGTGKAKMPHHTNGGCVCSQVHRNCTTTAFVLVLARILSLQTIPSTIAVLIRTQPSARFGNGSSSWLFSHSFTPLFYQMWMNVVTHGVDTKDRWMRSTVRAMQRKFLLGKGDQPVWRNPKQKPFNLSSMHITAVGDKQSLAANAIH